jgi:prepilin-type N-terminal cleavage/methylation domain-containing protein
MTKKPRAGFTLIELAVVLLVISLITGAGISLGNGALKTAARVKTQERLAIIKQAFSSYVAANGYLPCPADGALTPSSPSFGIETRSGIGCTPNAPGMIALTTTIYIGVMPTRTLGLPDSYAADSWGNKFTYAVSQTHVSKVSSVADTDGAITINYGDVSGTNYALTTKATYAVISHGPDGKGAFPLQGTAVGIACGATTNNDVANCDDADIIFYDTAYNDNATNAAQFFDDFVVWSSNITSRAKSTAPAYVSACPTGVCESWCAQCKSNLGGGTVGYTSFTAGTAVLCSRIITSTNPCEATCIWSGTTATGVIKCP